MEYLVACCYETAGLRILLFVIAKAFVLGISMHI
jgi:hypothetical protein